MNMAMGRFFETFKNNLINSKITSIFRYSDSPTSELEARTPKGRGGKRGRGGGTPVETETRKNLRSSKMNSKGRNNPTQANSPAKRKGRTGST